MYKEVIQIEPELGKEYYYAYILLPPFGVYNSMHMKCRAKDENSVVLSNKNVAYLVFKKDYDRIFENKRDCDKYLENIKVKHKGEKIYTEKETNND